MISSTVQLMISTMLTKMVPKNCRFMLLVIPTDKNPDDKTTWITNVPQNQLSEAGKVMRIISDHFDPRS